MQRPFVLINGSVSWVDAGGDQVGHDQSNSGESVETEKDPIVEERVNTDIEDDD